MPLIALSLSPQSFSADRVPHTTPGDGVGISGSGCIPSGSGFGEESEDCTDEREEECMADRKCVPLQMRFILYHHYNSTSKLMPKIAP